MQSDFRQRVFTPIVLPLALVGAVLLFAWSLAQILLLIPAAVAAMLALLLALYVLVIASLVASRRNISSRALSVSLAFGLLAIVAAGAVANAAGMREIEEHGAEEGEVAAEGEAGAEGAATEGTATEGGAAAEIPAGAAVWVADEIGPYTAAPDTLEAGEVTVAIENVGDIVHNVVFEELGSDPVVEAQAGEVDVATTSISAGDYVYYCSIPGHRAAGMEGSLVVQ